MQQLLLVRVKSIFHNCIELATSDVSQLYSRVEKKIFPFLSFNILIQIFAVPSKSRYERRQFFPCKENTVFRKCTNFIEASGDDVKSQRKEKARKKAHKCLIIRKRKLKNLTKHALNYPLYKTATF
jgi:hypothetical protein